MHFLIGGVQGYKVLTEGGLLITSILYDPLVGTREGLTLWGNGPSYRVGDFLSLSGKMASDKVQEGKSPHKASTLQLPEAHGF